MNSKYVLTLAQCTTDQQARIGGKGLGLGVLTNHGLDVPPGFAVTTDAYSACVKNAGLFERIAEILATSEKTRDASAAIEQLFTEAMLIPEVAQAIDSAYEAMGGSSVSVAVRSSATAEDTAEASFAGQQETYLWVNGAAEVRAHVVKCWASLFTQRAIDYRKLNKVPVDGLAMGVVVQQMVPAEAAGVIMTLHPVNGDRSQIYIESSYGLGEIVVRGEVEPDRFCYAKATGQILSAEIGHKERAYHHDTKNGGTELVAVPADEQDKPTLSDEEVRAVGDLAKRVEEHFAKPMDIEWAIATQPKTGQRQVFLLQARPETIWSNRIDPAEVKAVIGRNDSWDNLQSYADPDAFWTTTIVGEDIPGVATPLCWSLWGHSLEHGLRDTYFSIGVFTSAERLVPEHVDHRAIRMFYGRVAVSASLFATIGDRMPGTNGREVVQSLFGHVPEGMTFQPTKKRHLAIAWRFPWIFLIAPRRIRNDEEATTQWYQKSIVTVPNLDLENAKALFRAARKRFEHSMALQAVGLLCIVQPIYDALVKLAKKTGVDAAALTTQSGGNELAVVEDTWKASRGQLAFADVVRKHGYHGPGEGELANSSWREDDTPLRTMLTRYTKMDDSQSPSLRDQDTARRYEQVVREVLDKTPGWMKPFMRFFLKRATGRLVYRGIAKESFLQAFDVCRSTARRIGQLLVQQGKLKSAEDVFYLTAEELNSELPGDVGELVAKRRKRREAYTYLEIPTQFKGVPKVMTAEEAAAEALTASDADVAGIGVSAGVFEGTAVVVMSPDAEIDADQILVAPTTDPAWSPIMFISKGLVVDIGGALSHAAVVARELAIPCVVNTRNGTKVIKTGDRLRIDGSKGTVQILESASGSAGAQAGQVTSAAMRA